MKRQALSGKIRVMQGILLAGALALLAAILLVGRQGPEAQAVVTGLVQGYTVAVVLFIAAVYLLRRRAAGRGWRVLDTLVVLWGAAGVVLGVLFAAGIWQNILLWLIYGALSLGIALVIYFIQQMN